MNIFRNIWNGFIRAEIIAVVLGVALLFSARLAVSADSTDATEAEAVKIEKNIHAVTQAAKKYLNKTGEEAKSVDELKKAGFLSQKHDDNAQMVVDDSLLQVWGKGTGAYVMWNPEVSMAVCKRLNPGGTLPNARTRKPDPSKGFQCIDFGLGRYYILEPVYIHK